MYVDEDFIFFWKKKKQEQQHLHLSTVLAYINARILVIVVPRRKKKFYSGWLKFQNI